MGTCNGGNTMYTGGRRRRSGRKMRGGNMYGFGGALNDGTNGAAWNAVPNNAVNPVTLQSMPEYGTTGGRRRRTGKKVTRKGRRGTRKNRRVTRGRKVMRGGANWVSSAGVGASFGGDGVAGLGNYTAYAPKAPTGGPVQGGDGVYKV